MSIVKIHHKSSVNMLFGDLHSNSTVGLCAYQVGTDDGGHYRSSAAQRWIYARFEDFCKRTEKHVKNGRRRNILHMTINGETVDGVHHETTQICTSNKKQQTRNAVITLKPALDLQPDYIHVTKGTGVHSGKYGQMDEQVAEDIGAVPLYPDKPPEENVYARYLWLYECGGVLFEVSHHGQSAGLPHTEQNALNKLAFMRKTWYQNRGERIPDIIARAHTHKWGISSKGRWISDIMACITPSWQLSTEFASRIAPGDLLPIGGFIFDCRDGKYQFDPTECIYDPPGEKIWRP